MLHMSHSTGVEFPVGEALLALLVCFPLSFIFLPIGIISGIISLELFGLYPLSVLIGSVVVVQYDDGRLMNDYVRELRSGAVGFFSAGVGSGLIRIVMGLPSYQRFIEQEPVIFISVLYLIGIGPSLIYNQKA